MWIKIGAVLSTRPPLFVKVVKVAGADFLSGFMAGFKKLISFMACLI